MKSYLLLENGLQVACELPVEKNVTGCVAKEENGVWILSCGEEAYSLAPGAYSHLSFDKMQAKYVIDALPVEYHLYDLKTSWNGLH